MPKNKTRFMTFFVFLIMNMTGFRPVFAQSECIAFLEDATSYELKSKLNARTQIFDILEHRIYSVINDIETLTITIENPHYEVNQEGLKKLFALKNELKDQWEKAVEVLEELEQLKTYKDNAQLNILPQLQDLLKKISQEQRHFSSQKDYAARLILRYSSAKSMTFETIIENPKMVFAEYKYQMVMTTGEKIYMVFSTEIVNDLFLSEKTVQLRVLSRSLKDAQKGFFGANYEGSGVKRRLSNNEHVEIRSVGKDANFRLYGYVNNKNEIHIVSYTLSSNHGSSNFQKRITDGIAYARENRGH